MSELASRSGNVHWLGAGLSTGTGLNKVADAANKVILWNRTVSKAEALAERLSLTGKIETKAYDLDKLKAELNEGDIVVCMLPVAEHGTILDTAIAHGAHYVSSSYVSDIILGKVEAAKAKNLAVVVEAGLDPGIDHLASHLLVDDAEKALTELGSTADEVDAQFFSYCGGFPEVPNDFKYRFSWAPAGVLLALRSPAKFMKNGQEATAPRPWEETEIYKTSAGDFEAYPNRDSVPFIDQYHFPKSWNVKDFIRGTLRLPGWLDAWKDVFEAVKTGTDDDIRALGAKLADEHFYGPNDKDRVVLTVGLILSKGGKEIFNSRYEMDICGDDADSAMALTVSNGVACGIIDLLQGHSNVGLNKAAEDIESVKRWIDRLGDWGIHLTQK
ncbi:saccharopine dehydrogenase family protein [Curvivirga sp.]|uniref:saccharopine dehydrogenase family protein n=1 Tax=Curvivirga sp. TaxID=2856848 RepID=UPI003B5B4599